LSADARVPLKKQSIANIALLDGTDKHAGIAKNYAARRLGYRLRAVQTDVLVRQSRRLFQDWQPRGALNRAARQASRQARRPQGSSASYFNRQADNHCEPPCHPVHVAVACTPTRSGNG